MCSATNMAHSSNAAYQDNEEDRLEREHFQKVLRTFRKYKSHGIERVTKCQSDFQRLPQNHQKMLPDFIRHLGSIRTCIEHNYEFILQIVKNTDNMFENRENIPSQDSDLIVPLTSIEMDKVQTTLRQFVRDWSEDGQKERDTDYKPIIEEIMKRFPPDKCDVSKISVLVPGAGLGRLAYEIAGKGYICQGNEISLFMLFSSNFILNRSTGSKYLTIYPWVHSYCNNMCLEDQLHPVEIPDVNPADLQPSAAFSMAAGDFVEVYQDEDSWDCVATCYFIDTAHNVLAYIETIYNILKPGGYWINLGPLLYHFAGVKHEASIELSYDVLKKVILQFGFEILEERTVTSLYTHNKRNMLKYMYECVYFVCRKPYNVKVNGEPAQCQ